MAAKSNDITAGERGGASPEIDINFHCAEHSRYQDKLKCPLKKEVWKSAFFISHNISFGWHDGKSYLLSETLIFQLF